MNDIKDQIFLIPVKVVEDRDSGNLLLRPVGEAGDIMTRSAALSMAEFESALVAGAVRSKFKASVDGAVSVHAARLAQVEADKAAAKAVGRANAGHDAAINQAKLALSGVKALAVDLLDQKTRTAEGKIEEDREVPHEGKENSGGAPPTAKTGKK